MPAQRIVAPIAKISDWSFYSFSMWLFWRRSKSSGASNPLKLDLNWSTTLIKLASSPVHEYTFATLINPYSFTNTFSGLMSPTFLLCFLMSCLAAASANNKNHSYDSLKSCLSACLCLMSSESRYGKWGYWAWIVQILQWEFQCFRIARNRSWIMRVKEGADNLIVFCWVPWNVCSIIRTGYFVLWIWLRCICDFSLQLPVWRRWDWGVEMRICFTVVFWVGYFP